LLFLNKLQILFNAWCALDRAGKTKATETVKDGPELAQQGIYSTSGQTAGTPAQYSLATGGMKHCSKTNGIFMRDTFCIFNVETVKIIVKPFTLLLPLFFSPFP